MLPGGQATPVQAWDLYKECDDLDVEPELEANNDLWPRKGSRTNRDRVNAAQAALRTYMQRVQILTIDKIKRSLSKLGVYRRELQDAFDHVESLQTSADGDATIRAGLTKEIESRRNIVKGLEGLPHRTPEECEFFSSQKELLHKADRRLLDITRSATAWTRAKAELHAELNSLEGRIKALEEERDREV